MMEYRPNFVAAAAALYFYLGGYAAFAQQSQIWLALPENRLDFPNLFKEPQAWTHASKASSVFSININYFLHMPVPVIKQTLASLGAAGMLIDVGLPALPVDKHTCGDKIEGMIWPGEIEVDIKRLLYLQIPVSSFSFDLPLTNAHITHAPDACHLSVQDTAKRLATTMRSLRAQYPNARFVDVEVPTGILVSEWAQLLPEWLYYVRKESGEQFYGIALDMWWEFKWADTYLQSVQILHQNGVQVGTFIDADKGENPQTWITTAKRHACEVRALGEPDMVIVADWMQPDVPLLPEANPNSLVSIANWYASPNSCPPRASP